MENHIRDIKRIFVEERTKISFANKQKKILDTRESISFTRIQGK